MLRKTNLWRGLTVLCALLLAVSLMAGTILETYRTSVDAFFGTRSQTTVTEASENEEDAWTYQSDFKTAQEAYEGLREFAIRASQETYVLLKNENGALPLSSDAKITLLGIRSYAPVYSNSGGSVTDGKSTVQIFDPLQSGASSSTPPPSQPTRPTSQTSSGACPSSAAASCPSTPKSPPTRTPAS